MLALATITLISGKSALTLQTPLICLAKRSTLCRRNLGILFAMLIGFCAMYLTAAEYISSQKSKGEVLLFRRGQVPDFTKQRNDEEGNADDRPTTQDMIELQNTKSEVPPTIQKQTAIFHWAAVNYDIKIKGGERRLLDDVDGWVKPGTLTAVSRTFHTLNGS